MTWVARARSGRRRGGLGYPLGWAVGGLTPDDGSLYSYLGYLFVLGGILVRANGRDQRLLPCRRTFAPGAALTDLLAGGQ